MKHPSLITDAIEVLELHPTDARPLSKLDIKKISDLLDTPMTDEELDSCFQYLISKKAIGGKFRPKHMISWWTRRQAENQEDLISRSFENQRLLKEFKPRITSKSPRIPRNRTNNPVKDACKNLTDYLEALESDAPLDDPNVRKLLSACLFEFEKNPKARTALQKAYELIEESHKTDQAKKGEQFSLLSKQRLKNTKTNRIQKLERDVDFLMRNETDTNSGASVYFLLSPSQEKKPRRQQQEMHPQHERRLKELLTYPIRE